MLGRGTSAALLRGLRSSTLRPGVHRAVCALGGDGALRGAVLRGAVLRGATLIWAPTLINELFQLLTDLEEGKTLGRNRDGISGSWITSCVGLVGANRKAAKPPDLDTISAFERVGHCVKDTVDDELSASLGQFSPRRDGFDQLALRHPRTPLLSTTSDRFP